MVNGTIIFFISGPAVFVKEHAKIKGVSKNFYQIALLSDYFQGKNLPGLLFFTKRFG